MEEKIVMNDVSFGRLKPYWDKSGHLYHVSVVWSMGAGKPMYAQGRAMIIRSAQSDNVIYNPLRFNFNILRLKIALFFDLGDYEYVITDNYYIGENGLVAVDLALWENSRRVTAGFVSRHWNCESEGAERIYESLATALRRNVNAPS